MFSIKRAGLVSPVIQVLPAFLQLNSFSLAGSMRCFARIFTTSQAAKHPGLPPFFPLFSSNNFFRPGWQPVSGRARERERLVHIQRGPPVYPSFSLSRSLPLSPPFPRLCATAVAEERRSPESGLVARRVEVRLSARVRRRVRDAE